MEQVEQFAAKVRERILKSGAWIWDAGHGFEIDKIEARDAAIAILDATLAEFKEVGNGS